VSSAPDRHRLGREAAVGEAGDEGGVWTERAADLREDLDRALQVLDANAAERSVECAVV
jgi:hypothetical protein